jgi:hypothetical protein
VNRSIFVPEHTMSTLPFPIVNADNARLLAWLHFEYGPWSKRAQAFGDYQRGRHAHFVADFEDRVKRPLPPELEGPPPVNPGPCAWYSEAGPIALGDRQLEAVLRLCETRGVTLSFAVRLALVPVDAGHFVAIRPLGGVELLALHALMVPCHFDGRAWTVAPTHLVELLEEAAALRYRRPRSRSILTFTPGAEVRSWVASDGTEHAPGTAATFIHRRP